jgi:death-on-curing protein
VIPGTKRNEPSWISEPTLLAIHAQQIERFGGSHGVIDVNVVLSALARAKNRWAYDSSADLADLSASYLVGFARSQGFSDGNKRTGLACALVFLSLNKARLHVPPAELYALTMSAAIGKADDQTVPAYFRDRIAARQSVREGRR